LFLSDLTGINCRTMTAHEFEYNNRLSSLGSFFRNLDELRFSGLEIDNLKITLLLDNLKGYLNIEVLQNEL
jgi:hypothetical protein